MLDIWKWIWESSNHLTCTTFPTLPPPIIDLILPSGWARDRLSANQPSAVNQWATFALCKGDLIPRVGVTWQLIFHKTLYTDSGPFEPGSFYLVKWNRSMGSWFASQKNKKKSSPRLQLAVKKNSLTLTKSPMATSTMYARQRFTIMNTRSCNAQSWGLDRT